MDGFKIDPKQELMNSKSIAIFAGGCFWCTEAIFSRLKGVISVESGFCGGNVDNPSYEQVSLGKTGHAESLKIVFDGQIISFEQLLNVFFHTHNPTTLNRQGNDVGTQYRSVIFCLNDEQFKIASNFIQRLNTSKAYDKPIVTEVLKIKESDFFKAEDYHQKYYDTHKDLPYCELVIAPKIEKLNKEFGELVK
jgi:peptide-methionine (S)-S-oxide reductase